MRNQETAQTLYERKSRRNGEEIIEVRSPGGKLMYVKTRAGYEMKCPRTKRICLIPYEAMLADCVQCLAEAAEQGTQSNLQSMLRSDVFQRFAR